MKTPVWLAAAAAVFGIACTAMATPSNVQAFFRDGQTFITWTEDGSATYDIYRHTGAITAGTIALATKVATVNNQTSNTVFSIGAPIGQTHWIIQPKTNGTGLGTELTDNDGLFVHTTHETSGDFYYAVCSGGATTISGNTVGPITEQKMVTKPVPIWRGRDSGNRLNVHFAQFMDYSIWQTNYEGYIINFAAEFPQSWETSNGPFPVVSNFEGRSGRISQYIPSPSDYNISLYHDAVASSNGMQDWYYGHQNKDSSAVYNYTEYRVIKAILFVLSDLKGDANHVFAWGGSMGGSACLSLAERYPTIFSAVYCSQPATDWSNEMFMWTADAWANFGMRRGGNPPIYNIPFDDPAHPELDALLQPYNGTPVRTWQNIREQLIVRAGDDMPLICATHGTNDGSIDWPTQGQPFGPVLLNSRRPFKYIVNDATHTFQTFNSVYFPQMFASGNVTAEYLFSLDQSMPGFSAIDSGNSMKGCTWTVVQDTRDVWEMTIAGAGQACGITPRRCQAFEVNQGDSFSVYLDNVLVQAGLVGDTAGLVTAGNLDLTTTKTVKFVNTYRTAVEKQGKQAMGPLLTIDARPNPFNPVVTITISNSGPETARPDIKVYAINGDLIADMSHAIRHSFTWDASNFPSGVYVVRVRAGARTADQRIILVK